ncbi:hypothetical protein THIOM_000145 [Candidatus Thiomargarita nelsonii]|uniref:Uncharacterized protein n=1 Tax=Candidatus Thiomargarita nelsonii TaxID=1003181 RepID=A0A0A6RKD1_9GAMM|nr:hypothetical protein THIOM_000145 [Candidatus Thiomargarita nelsonii]
MFFSGSHAEAGEPEKMSFGVQDLSWTSRTRLTVRQLRQSGLIGLWKNRDDIIDSAVYARQLREQAQQRRPFSYDFS